MRFSFFPSFFFLLLHMERGWKWLQWHPLRAKITASWCLWNWKVEQHLFNSIHFFIDLYIETDWLFQKEDRVFRDFLWDFTSRDLTSSNMFWGCILWGYVSVWKHQRFHFEWYEVTSWGSQHKSYQMVELNYCPLFDQVRCYLLLVARVFLLLDEYIIIFYLSKNSWKLKILSATWLISICSFYIHFSRSPPQLFK